MSIELITVFLFIGLAVLLISGLPVVFVLGGISLLFTLWLWGPDALFMITSRAMGVMTNFLMVAIPLFIFMANALERSGVADDLYTMMHHWMGNLKGGLAMGTVVICTIFAAMSGISGAATVTMALIALPSMLKRNYNKLIALGSIAAGGALGVLIPPSCIMIVYALMSGVSVGRLFLGGVFPGLILAVLFIIYIGIRSYLQPELGPPLPPEERVSLREKFTSLRAVILPMLLIMGVLGTIFTGVCTPSEASAIGAVGSLVCAAIYRRLTWQLLSETCYRTLRLSAMVLWIAIAAACFSATYNAIGGPKLIGELLIGLPFGRWGVLILLQVIFIFLGMFMESLAIMFICAPIFVPVVAELGFNTTWFGVLFVVNMEMSYLTPPFGFNLFYIRSVAPPGVTMGDIYRSIAPFVILQLIGLILVMIFPQIILWLPDLIVKQ